MSAYETVILAIGSAALLAVLTTYVLYPFTMFMLSLLRARPLQRDERLLPEVTMVVAGNHPKFSRTEANEP